MDLIHETEVFNSRKKEYESLVLNNIDEAYIRKLIDNKVISDSVYNRLESINVYNDFDPNRRGKYDVIIDHGKLTYEGNRIIIYGYRYDDNLTGEQTNTRLKKHFNMDIFEFLDSINEVFFNDTHLSPIK